MEEAKNLHVHDFGIFEPVPEPRNLLFNIFGNTKTPKLNRENPWNMFRTYYSYKYKKWKSIMLSIWEKTGAENPSDPSNKILRILEMRSISSWKHEMEMG